jgi:hypothetical protein
MPARFDAASRRRPQASGGFTGLAEPRTVSVHEHAAHVSLNIQRGYPMNCHDSHARLFAHRSMR